ncbi:hypothetical protein ASE16_03470 [Leifsonia sp. Root227]|uniref:hypothetical protein n=1 Tax=Leifsonia sp. Root227 TaxID=1736496 RepID=UPI0007014B9C|nr:hypothetical protein [Leifsonia sp. Root227]KRC52120.1 hypothetical protein ASE16_03470 [Leifsonia sp. Root227]
MPSLEFGDAWPWLQWVLAVAAVVAFIGGAIKVIPSAWRFVSRFVTTINSLADLPEFIDKTKDTLKAQDASLASIKHEVLPNNGGSLRDAVDRHGEVLADVQAKLANDNTRIIELQARDAQGRFAKKEDL